MDRRDDSYAHEFMADAQKADRCEWCAREKRKNRKGLCRHCDKIRRTIEQLERLPRRDFLLDWELRVARAERKDCKAWGGLLRGILGHVDPINLERWFSMLSERIAGRDMHSNSATMLGWTFSPGERQVLAYMFWQMFGENASRNRRSRVAAGDEG